MADQPADPVGGGGDTIGGKVGSLFGFLFNRKPEPPTVKAIVPPNTDDGAVTIAAGGTQGIFIDLDASIKTEADLVGRYREMALQPEVDRAINEIVNEAITQEEGEETVEIVLDNLLISPQLKMLIQAEFKNLLNIVDFENHCYELFRKWYIEGRLYFQVVIDEKQPKEGIKELRWIDPRRIRKVREMIKIKDPTSEAMLQRIKSEYYIYSESGLNYGSRVMSSMGTMGLRIAKDSIIHVPSGLTDVNGMMGISYLHNAIKSLNQLRQLEDSTMIYYFSRAPERRIFYIDVGNLPRAKAEEYIHNMMLSHKNKLSYNAMTGELIDDRKMMTFVEDFWFPRREGGKGTEVVPLAGGTQLPDLLDSVQYFQDKLYRSLQVPITRMKPDTLTSLGRATEVTRDEVNFSKFIDRLRRKFSQFFMRALERQLVLKNIVTPDDWDVMRKSIRFRYLRDNYFAELKEREIFLDRLMAVQAADPFAGKYFSHTWIRTNILRQTEEDMMEMDQQIADDLQNPLYNVPLFTQPTEQPPPFGDNPDGNGPPGSDGPPPKKDKGPPSKGDKGDKGPPKKDKGPPGKDAKDKKKPPEKG